jgi:hypothetical protein
LTTQAIEPTPYTLRISRLTVDKLGVKLYDRVSAVAAELIANSYDADATKVTVRAPLSTQLDAPSPDGDPWVVTVEDNGHGMTPTEAQAYFLQVGRDRRQHIQQGARSRELDRPVIGRKGIGKLAPFGVCKRIEVLSSGGDRTSRGYNTSHFILDFDAITSEDSDIPVPLEVGEHDRSWRADRGTTVTLHSFLRKRVPDERTFVRQMARRFALADPEFSVLVVDTRTSSPAVEVPKFEVPTMENSVIDLANRSVQLPDGTEKPIRGWIGLASEAYKDEEMAGVRIYARGKIIATTRDFEQPAGFTGEFTIRSYLVGEVHAEWLDDDDGDDLIRTDRQAILWESDLGAALRQWGADLIREVGQMAREPRRQRTRQLFMERSRLRQRAEERFAEESVVKAAIELGETIGNFAAEDELNDESYVNGLAEVILAVAPHKALIQAFQEFSKERSGGVEPDVDDLLELFGKTRIAEMASYAQIAAERVQVLNKLEEIFGSSSNESDLQKIIASAPWLIHPEWAVITQNQSLRTFRDLFREHWLANHGEEVELAIDWEDVRRKRPDFILVAVSGRLFIVEIKAAGHKFDRNDLERLHKYVDAFNDFKDANPDVMRDYGRGWQIQLIADGENLSGPMRTAFESLKERKIVQRMSWAEFRAKAKRANELFLEAHTLAQRKAQEQSKARVTEGAL